LLACFKVRQSILWRTTLLCCYSLGLIAIIPCFFFSRLRLLIRPNLIKISGNSGLWINTIIRNLTYTVVERPDWYLHFDIFWDCAFLLRS
jgi:hypothetical protein